MGVLDNMKVSDLEYEVERLRDADVRLRAAERQVRELEADKAGLRHTVTELEDELDDANTRIAELGAENATLREELSALRVDMAEAAEAVGVVQDNLSALQSAARAVL